MSKTKKKPDLTSLMGGAAKVSGATPPQSVPEPTRTPEPANKAVKTVAELEKSPVKLTPNAIIKPEIVEKIESNENAKPQKAQKKKAEEYMMTSIAFDADDMKDLQEVSMSFMTHSGSLKYPTRNMVAKVGIKAAHILSLEDPKRLLELFEIVRSKDKRYAENRD